jgi:ABC-2 type transport system ATP-binding protein
VVIINKGRIVANDTASFLQQSMSLQTVYVEFEGSVSKDMLAKIPHVGKVEAVKEGWLIETRDDVDLRKEISRFAQKNDLLVLTLRAEEKSLEEVFKELTK